ncbi:DUF2603 domain-containing protein [Helicobacter kayseriensis]|uniref:DUF2603 domain-containing protein n=1 Tax=Helicobacter kayseriensis TaxID=2905877 RepID=UPI001E54037D|nr:DUF2603 domain-containing protein [Helicobacter kayseriensis]MCE3047422.1 DUF2603 domain-containing protein [Helicobacter kayseriensis]MCE3048907.1 DUF2603 domain-containing protein [Helicobacter kayseriensis]
MLELNGEITNGNLTKIDEKHLSIQLENGNLSLGKPCFVSDENGDEYVLISTNILKRLLEGIKKAQEEKFTISLERDIANQMPLDFEDVMSVAKAKMRELDLNTEELDSAELIEEIKREHPNLFFNIDEYLRK